MTRLTLLIAGCLLLFVSISSLAVEPPTYFTNKDSVAYTRHNMNQRQPDGSTEATARFMDYIRNDYNQVCVYCHTPHGANTTTTAPLWNRTMLTTTTYTTYTSMSIEGTVGGPGANSLTCLSCHDGKVGTDSIINMPGSGKYSSAQETSQNNTFLNTWGRSPNSNILPSVNGHGRLDPAGISCMMCHNSDAGEIGSFDFTAFALGTDLSNDHPIGVLYRGLTTGTDYAGGTTPTADGKLLYFDTDGDARPDKDEVRFYNTGGGYEVECASCHDPHGVPSGGAGSAFKATFLRIANTGSALCLTCHTK